jgi:hypothetical protein
VAGVSAGGPAPVWPQRPVTRPASQWRTNRPLQFTAVAIVAALLGALCGGGFVAVASLIANGMDRHHGSFDQERREPRRYGNLPANPSPPANPLPPANPSPSASPSPTR